MILPMETTLISKKLEALEQELQSLKTMVLGTPKKKVVSLKGLLKGMKVTDQDFEDAKHSLFQSS